MTTLRLGRLDVGVAGNRLVLAGRIDDSVNFSDLLAQLAPGPITLDTGGVTFVNSIGMRELRRLVRALRERGSAISLERVADVLITQLNMIPDLAKAVSVASFHAQYACASCGAEGTPVVDALAHAQMLRQMQAPRLPCPECGGVMELADFPDRYLSIFRV